MGVRPPDALHSMVCGIPQHHLCHPTRWECVKKSQCWATTPMHQQGWHHAQGGPQTNACGGQRRGGVAISPRVPLLLFMEHRKLATQSECTNTGQSSLIGAGRSSHPTPNPCSLDEKKALFLIHQENRHQNSLY